MADDTRGFLKRWSHRKQQSADAPAVEPQPENIPLDTAVNEIQPVQQAEETVPAEAEAAISPAPDETHEQTSQALTDDDMPPIETLDGSSDYSPFLSEGVSKELRNLALKKLFFSGKFAIRDGLDDYDDDFTRFEPLGDTVTSDMKFHQRRKERERLAKLEEEEQQALAEEGVEDDDEPDNEAVSDEAAEPTATESSENPPEQSPEQPPEHPQHQDAPADDENVLLTEHDEGSQQQNVAGKLRKKLPRNPTPNNDHHHGDAANDDRSELT